MNREDRLRYAINDAQLFGVKGYQRIDGAARGERVYHVTTGGGLEYEVLPDRAMDLLGVTYKGVNVSYLSKMGHTSDHHPFENDFLHYYSGGLLYTCGMLNVGPGNLDAGTYHPLHGRAHTLPADHFGTTQNEDGVRLSGVMREAALFGHCLTLRRTLRSDAFSTEIVVEDEIENLTPESVEIMMLYHINFGYPFLSEHLKLRLPAGTRTWPRTPFAAEALDRVCEFTQPIDGLEERVYFHDIPAENGLSSLALLNEKLGFGAEVACTKASLPYVAEWKSMRSGDYALGIEPSNNLIHGRSKERENGTLQVLAPFSKQKFCVKIRFFDL